jgi:hypothetical protein
MAGSLDGGSGEATEPVDGGRTGLRKANVDRGCIGSLILGGDDMRS